MIIVIDIKFYFMILLQIHVFRLWMLFRSLWKLVANASHDANDTLLRSPHSNRIDILQWVTGFLRTCQKWHAVFLESCRYNELSTAQKWVNVNSHGDEDGFQLYVANMNGQETQLAHWICRIFQLASYFLLNNNHKWLLSKSSSAVWPRETGDGAWFKRYSSFVRLTFVVVIKVKSKSCAANESFFHLSNLITMLMNGCVVFNIVHLMPLWERKKLDLSLTMAISMLKYWIYRCWTTIYYH